MSLRIALVLLLWPLMGAMSAPVARAVEGDSEARPLYRISARIDPRAHQIAGSATIELPAGPAPTWAKVRFFLFPDRFSRDGPEVDDVTREAVWPRGEANAGGIEILAVRTGGSSATGAPGVNSGSADGLATAVVAGTPLPHRTLIIEEAPRVALLEVDLPANGAGGRLVIDFRSTLPERYGPFGDTEEALTAIGGWHPLLVGRGDHGDWRVHDPPPFADFAVDVTVDPSPSGEGATLVAGSMVLPGAPGVTHSVHLSQARIFALSWIPEATHTPVRVPDAGMVVVGPTERRASRIGFGPDPAERLRSALAAILEHRPEGLRAPAELVVLQAPLRWNLTTPADGLAVISDRTMQLNPVLDGFHDAQVAQSVYAEMLRPVVVARESEFDRYPIQHAVAWILADAFLRAELPEHRTVHDWIGWFDVFAIVDRFESAPKIPFSGALFDNARREDELRESALTFATDRVAPRLVVARLARSIPRDTLLAAAWAYVATPPGPGSSFAEMLAGASGRPLDEVRRLLAEAGSADRTLGSERSLSDGTPDGARTEPAADRAIATAGAPGSPQLVLDTADVEVSSSEIAFAALLVGRFRYDYTKDLAINPYLTERASGVYAGPRFHWGVKNDATSFRHNLFGFVNYSALDSGFEDDSRPGRRDSGHAVGFGARYDYSNVVWPENPTRQRQFRLFLDGYDPALGGDFGFLRWGVRASATHPLFTSRTIGAVEGMLGFEEPTGSTDVPIQMQYALGGRLALRGVSIHRRLGRNIGLLRAEVRQDVYPEWSLDFLDLVTYRRPQLRFFVDSGQVDDSAGRALDPGNWAVAGGIGVNVVYDFLGFFPGRAYVEVATRLDQEQSDVQFLFGTRQAF